MTARELLTRTKGIGEVMKTIEYTNIDRTKWPSGPWNNEPDKVQWQDEATGLPCLVKRHNRSGHWCGYVGVSPEHKLHQVPYDEVNAEVHGGLTYSDVCDGDEETGICHKPDAGEPEHVWWFGFDCNHCCDLSPTRGNEYLFKDHFSMYRDLEYVKSECESLAKQLAGMT